MIVLFGLLTYVTLMLLFGVHVLSSAALGTRLGARVEKIGVGADPVLFSTTFRSVELTIAPFPRDVKFAERQKDNPRRFQFLQVSEHVGVRVAC